MSVNSWPGFRFAQSELLAFVDEFRMNNKLTAAKTKSFNAAIGRFVLEWAGLELGVDLLVVILARPLSSNKFPHEIKTKLNLIESNATTLGLPQTAKRHLLSLIKEIKSLVPVRHDYVHGAMISHTFTKSNLTVTLARLLQPPIESEVNLPRLPRDCLRKDRIGFTRSGTNCLILPKLPTTRILRSLR